MTDLAELSADELAEKVLALFGTEETPWRAKAAGWLSELVRRASERDQAVRERDEHLAHLASEEDAYCRQRDLRKEAEAERDQAEQRADRLAAALEPFADLVVRQEQGTVAVAIEVAWLDAARDALAASQETPA